MLCINMTVSIFRFKGGRGTIMKHDKFIVFAITAKGLELYEFSK